MVAGRRNPFRPTYGTSPPKLAGRDEPLTMFADGLDEGPGAPNRSMLVLGQRGMGKTTVLNGIEDIANQQGWYTFSETGHEGLITRINERLVATLIDDDVDATRSNMTSVSMPAGLGSLSWATENEYERANSTRSYLTRLADIANERGTGVLITIDEVHAANQSELRALTTVVQHCFREERNVAFAAAGLPAAVSELLLDDPVLTFLRRSERVDLDRVSRPEVRDALRDSATDAGRSFDDDALEAATDMTAGYPYLIQLVGYHSWRQHPHEDRITLDDVVRAAPVVADRLGRQVLEPALAPLSMQDRRFIEAMALDDGPTSVADLAERLDVDGNYTNQYRSRLLASELVVQAGRGRLDFNLPGLRSYLRNQLDNQLELREPRVDL